MMYAGRPGGQHDNLIIQFAVAANPVFSGIEKIGENQALANPSKASATAALRARLLREARA